MLRQSYTIFLRRAENQPAVAILFYENSDDSDQSDELGETFSEKTDGADYWAFLLFLSALTMS